MLDHTTVLHIVSRKLSKQHKTILVCSRDAGSANALLPVLTLLQDKYNIYCLTDGLAKDIFLQHLQTQTLPAPQSVLYDKDLIPKPDLVLVDPSASDRGIEDYAEAHFQSAPLVLLEDYYATANLALARFAELGVTPAKICVLDKFAQDLVVQAFPKLTPQVVITGQPAFDSIVQEDAVAIRQSTRAGLRLDNTDKLITFFSASSDVADLVQQLKTSIAKLDNHKIRFIIRYHPKDQSHISDTAQFTSDQISLASDLVITTTSVEGLRAIVRQKPTIHITDRRFGGFSSTLPNNFVPPPCMVGASIAVPDVTKLAEVILQLLDPASSTTQQLQAAMKQYYRLDGQNTARVTAVIDKIFNTR